MTAELVARGLRKSYGDLVVLDDVDFSVRTGESVGVVGPNGAGKTTLLSALAGTVTVESGTVTIVPDGAGGGAALELTGLPSHRRCRSGVSRAYQVPRPFGGMTVLENVLVGATQGARLHRSAARAKALGVLERVGLAEFGNRRADSLGLLHRKRLEVARALATDPTVILLDEIAAGLTDAEAAEIVTLVRGLRDDGLAVVWIEHIVHVLVQAIDRLIAMDSGRIIADGPPAAVLENAVVVDAYLGKGAS
jgi:branched-chain amino acid transport system ATP-binding protein